MALLNISYDIAVIRFTIAQSCELHFLEMGINTSYTMWIKIRHYLTPNKYIKMSRLSERDQVLDQGLESSHL